MDAKWLMTSNGNRVAPIMEFHCVLEKVCTWNYRPCPSVKFLYVVSFCLQEIFILFMTTREGEYEAHEWHKRQTEERWTV